MPARDFTFFEPWQHVTNLDLEPGSVFLATVEYSGGEAVTIPVLYNDAGEFVSLHPGRPSMGLLRSAMPLPDPDDL